MAFIRAVTQGLLFVLFVMLAVAATVRWGIVGIAIALVVFLGVAAAAVRRVGPRGHETERTAHDWHEE